MQKDHVPDAGDFPATKFMRLASLNSSAAFHCFISGISLCGSFAGWYFWFSYGGWQRQSHWIDGTLWAASGIIGIWAAVDTIRFARSLGVRGAMPAALATLFAMLNSLSLLLFWMFVAMLMQGGPR